MKLIIVTILFTLLGITCADPTGVIRGKVLIAPGMNHSSTVIFLHTAQGEQVRTFVGSDGSFTLGDVPPGVHLLQPFHRSLVYPEIRIEINRKGTLTRASLSLNRNLVLHSPLLLRPAMEAQYFEKRKPFDVWSFVKSPYGIMIVISVLAIVVFPRMKMDPEDYKELQEQMRGGGSGQAEGAASNQAALTGQRQQAARLRDR